MDDKEDYTSTNLGPDGSNDIIEFAPLAFVTIGEDHHIKYINQNGKLLLQCEATTDFRSLVHPNFVRSYETLWHQSPTVETPAYLQLLGEAGTKYVKMTAARHPDGYLYTWIADLSETRALRAELQRNRQPGRRFLHEISNTLTANIGYAELIQMLLKEGNAVTGETLASLRRYARELRDGLQKTESLVTWEKQGHKKLQSSKVTPVKRQHVLIVDDEPGVAEFLAELMRGRQHKVTAITDGIAALEYFNENFEQIDLVILDQMMPDVTGIALATEMLSRVPDLPIILCTGDEQTIADQKMGKLKIKHFVSKPIDINDLMQQVIAILEEGD